MKSNWIKGQILEAKWNLYKVQQEKYIAAKNQRFERASELRFEEKHLKERLNDLKAGIIKSLENFQPDAENRDDFIFLNELLLEFYPNEFYCNCSEAKSLEIIVIYINTYWQMRQEMYQKFMNFLDEEYVYIRENVRQFQKDQNEEKTLLAIDRLRSIGEFLLLNKP